MTLASTLREKLNEWRPPQGRQSMSAADPASGWAVGITADRADPVGCEVWELTAVRTGAAPAGETARSWAERVAARATGLLEPLRVHEVDAARGEALLRSGEPTHRGDDCFYYEVQLRGAASAAVRRYRGAKPGGHREQVPFALTHDGIAKLAGDLTAPA
jgi:hypothetical protein